MSETIKNHSVYVAIPRIDGTKTEALFDIVVVDKDKTNRIRFGAGSDRIIDY